MWQDRTGAATPDAWAAAHKMPVSVLFAEAQDAEAVVRVVAEPSAYQAEVLKAAKARLEKAALVAEDGLAAAFAARFVPAKYAALGLDVAALCAELAAKLPGNPNGWTLQGAAFYKAVAALVAEDGLAAAFRPKAIEKVKTLSDDEVRERLLRLVEENPDVGLKILA